MQRYLLPVVAVVETMKGLPETVSLQAQISSVPGVSKETCVAEIIVGEGRLHGCTILTLAGHTLLQNQEAFAVLQRMGKLEWQLVPGSREQQVGPRQEQGQSLWSGSSEQDMRPCRIGAPSSLQLQSLPFDQRRVLYLVDGQKTISQLARLLQKNPEEIHILLLALYEKHYISFLNL